MRACRPAWILRLAMAACLTFAVTGCADSAGSAEESAAETAPAPSRPAGTVGRVIFDMSHGEVFGADDVTDLGQSSAVATIEEAGFAVDVRSQRLDAAALKGVSGVIFPGPMNAFTAGEIDALKDYLAQGGVVVLTLHVPFALDDLLALAGVRVGDVVQSAEPGPSADRGVLLADRVAPHQLTEDVDSVLLLSSWSLETSATGPQPLVLTGEDTLLDTDGDGMPSAADRTGPFAVVTVNKVGPGTVIVCGDDAVFANAAIGGADNRQLLRNILELMASVTQPT